MHGCHHCVIDDQREAGEDKQNKQEKSGTAHTRERGGVVPLALPLMAGRGAAISSTIVWGRVICIAHLPSGFRLPYAFARFAAGACSVWRRGWFVCWNRNRYQRYYRIMGVV